MIKEEVPTPNHYAGTIQPKDFIRTHNLNFNRGCAVKYLTRAGRKVSKDESKLSASVADLKKAQDYITFEINALMEQMAYEAEFPDERKED